MNPGNLDNFDSDAIEILNKILDTIPNLEIVVSSDWKKWVPIEEMQEFYRRQGIRKVPISYTKDFNPIRHIFSSYNQMRAAEIQKWLLENPSVKEWVAIDDIDMGNYLDNFIWISKPNEGICNKYIQDKLLNYYL